VICYESPWEGCSIDVTWAGNRKRSVAERCRSNMVGMGKGWPSRSGQILVLLLIRMWIYDHHFTLLNIRRLAFYTIYCHSREDDTASLRRPWRSLRSLSALVTNVTVKRLHQTSAVVLRSCGSTLQWGARQGLLCWDHFFIFLTVWMTVIGLMYGSSKCLIDNRMTKGLWCLYRVTENMGNSGYTLKYFVHNEPPEVQWKMVGKNERRGSGRGMLFLQKG